MTARPSDSIRLILPEGSPLLENLAALWTVDPRLAEELEKLGDVPEYPTETAADGKATIALDTAAERKILLHSRHHPEAEARKLVAKAPIDEKLIFYVLGMGLGYHVQGLWSEAGEETVFCIFEPDLKLIWTAFCQNDFSRLIRSRRVLFFWELDKSYLFSKLTPQSVLVSVGAHTVSYPPSIALHPDFYAQINVWLDELASFVRTGMNTLISNSAKTAENIAANIGWYAATPAAARLKDRYRSRPAVIVSAGPSLRKNKHLLKGLEDRAVVIAVQTTLQPLLEMGVKPHFVTSLDYHEICSRFFEKLPPNLDTELVAEPKATEAVFKMYPGPMTVLGNEFAESLVREIKLDKTRLPAGATVAHLAYYLAEHLGCDPIIFVGQDLAFSDGLCYTPGTSYEDVWRPELSRFCTVEMKQWEQIARDKYLLRKVPDGRGKPIYTEERLFMYLQQFERDFGKSRATIIDATEGGAHKRGTVPMPLAEAIERYCIEKLPANRVDHPGLNWELLESCVASLKNRREEAEEIRQISLRTLPLVEEIAENLHDQARVNRLITSIDQLRTAMGELGQTYDMVTQLTQETELERFKRDRKVTLCKAGALAKQKLQIERDIDNVKALIEATGAFMRLMDQTAEQLKSKMSATRRSLAA